uniref:Chlorophyll a-b binding protein, chloroplastic n=1 Tax=Mantoniella antarctica TaxID=81844 RepID=A0A7S0X9S4_9CHLO|mmetsp:Transcript_43800/g.70397  ORF Transcript_43800/g.70397 Transcript_43800/m.70397 type:complete len:229 (-) Transcript_43800:231-917(-)|eukprot:CAMPEP_0198683956 /NCGR_PEP_ID=MMETSP1468-20131203/11465_1 /TAXON_ID=1461545 /ORGANISM="Mantoniella sp, Strain CCMP1436" /LENGTH=228 /DNA_ID=CAMNT_0044428411 /DNA_START=82 /DNA_END=768 /DNA_ORIENTATION=+
MAAICSLAPRIVCAARAPKVRAAAEEPPAPPPLKAGSTYKDLNAAVKAGLVQGCAPFGNGIDAFGFYNNIDQAEAQRFADVEITHGRVAMLAALGFFVGEQVEGSAFLFDASVTGPAINHFQQVPTFFAVTLGVGIILAETNRVNQAWQSPFEASRLFLQKDSHVPGDYAWDPLGLSKGKSANDMKSIKMKELNNGRLAMVAIAGLVGQELVDGQNVFQSGVDAAAAQ